MTVAVEHQAQQRRARATGAYQEEWIEIFGFRNTHLHAPLAYSG
jgi:hypothetical protein